VADPWMPAIWSPNGGRHFPVPHVEWKTVVASTALGQRVAKYHPGMTAALIQAMELQIVREEWHEIDPEWMTNRRPRVRMFWRHVENLAHDLGASEGFRTNYIYVEYHSTGTVHGRPVTERELKRRGANL
jgi:hypothetical protein